MLGPGIGGFEVVVIALVALIVVGPKDLPMLMRKVGQFLGRARRMAAEFRASFDEMARQSELDDLRKEVEALRKGQALVDQDTRSTFADIHKELSAPAPDAATPLTKTPPLTEPAAPEPASKPKTAKAKAASAPKAPRAPRGKRAPK